MDVKKMLVLIIATLVIGCGTSEEGSEKAGGDADTDAIAFAVNAAEKGDSSLGVAWRGDLDWGSSESDEVTASVPLHAWTVEVGAGSAVYIDGASRQGYDMFLGLYERGENGAWQFLDYNDDCYDGTRNACIGRTLTDEGEYLVVITTYEYAYWGARTYARYELTVWCDDPDGECGVTPEEQLCGSRGLEPCDDGFYCDFDDDQCGAADAPGVCTPIPQACYEIDSPVCACDGATYSNECHAAAAGVDVSALCEPEDVDRGEGEMCGGIAGFVCSAPLVCDFSGNDACLSDAAGTCVQPTEVLCTQQYDPVCGCDGVTYSNDCMRRGAYVALDHSGPC